jgi:replicative DNA helicase
MAYRTQSEKNIDRLQPPQSLDAEQAVLGAVLKDADAINQVIETLESPSHFYYPRHQIIYQAILDLYERTEPCDITTVADVLQTGDQLERIGGRVYLVELVESIATAANVQHHASIVLEKSVMRQLIQASNDIVKSCYAMEQPAEELLDAAEHNIFQISESRMRKGFTPIRELINPTFEAIENLQSPESVLVGIKTGYAELDVMTNGLHRGDFIVVAGRPSMGKSALVMNIAEHVAVENKKCVGIFSIEMAKEQLALRMLCGRARISQQRLRARKLRSEEWQKLTIAGGPLSEAPIFIDDSPTLSALEIRAKARRLKAQHDVSLLVVDYLQMVHGSGRYENRQQEMAGISRLLKVLAKELDIPVIACSQLSRQVEQRGGEKRPQLSDLRESGAIEQDADVVAFIYRPEHYLSHLDKNDPKYLEIEGRAEIIVAKQRNGPTGVVHLAFLKEFARFENMAGQGYRELPPDIEPVDGGDIPF